MKAVPPKRTTENETAQSTSAPSTTMVGAKAFDSKLSNYASKVPPDKRITGPPAAPEPLPSYNSDTVTLNTVTDYTPGYMEFYKDLSPKVVDQEPVLTPHNSSHNSEELFRRNSIDKRGMNNEKVEEEFQNQLKRLDHVPITARS